MRLCRTDPAGAAEGGRGRRQGRISAGRLVDPHQRQRRARPDAPTSTRFSQFLTLVGLTALIVGGVGVANAVRACLDSKRGVIATFKCLGAPGALIFMIYLMQITLIALVGIAIGLDVGIAMPFAAIGLLRGVLPVAARASFYAGPLLLAAVFGLLTALAFADPAAGAHARRAGDGAFPRPGLRALRLAAPRLRRRHGGADPGARRSVAVATAREKHIALIFLGAIAFAFVVLRAVSVAGPVDRARTRRTVRSTALRLAIGNIHRPGALTPSVVLSLGLGLALLVTLALIDGNLRREVADNIPAKAPNFFFVDIQNHEIGPLKDLLHKAGPGGEDRRRADAARADRRAQGHRRDEDEGHPARRSLGAARRPRHHLCREPAREHRRSPRANGGAGTTTASRSSRSPTTRPATSA